MLVHKTTPNQPGPPTPAPAEAERRALAVDLQEKLRIGEALSRAMIGAYPNGFSYAAVQRYGKHLSGDERASLVRRLDAFPFDDGEEEPEP
jgi:hypothetical protein